VILDLELESSHCMFKWIELVIRSVKYGEIRLLCINVLGNFSSMKRYKSSMPIGRLT
jgi:hypothetical protein